MRLCVTDMIGNYSSLFQFHMQSQMVQINFPSGNNISFVWALIKKRREKYLKNQDLDQFVLPPPTFPWIQMLQLDTDGIFCQRLKKKITACQVRFYTDATIQKEKSIGWHFSATFRAIWLQHDPERFCCPQRMKPPSFHIRFLLWIHVRSWTEEKRASVAWGESVDGEFGKIKMRWRKLRVLSGKKIYYGQRSEKHG